MGKYADVAIRAVSLYTSGEASSIVEAWEIVACKTFETETSRKKSCPRTTFLGACESGIVVGVPAGVYNLKLKRNKNKQYGLKAITLLQQDPALADHPNLLWLKIGNAGIKKNDQMDVITTLWKQGLIRADHEAAPRPIMKNTPC